MSRILTIAEMVADVEQIAKKVCEEDGLVYEDFIADLAQALAKNGVL